MDRIYYIYLGISLIILLIIFYVLYFVKDGSKTSLIITSVNLSKRFKDLEFGRTHIPESTIYSYSMNVLVEGVLNNIDADEIKKYYLFYRNVDGFDERAWTANNHGKNIGLRLDATDLTKLFLDYTVGTNTPRYKTVEIVNNFPIGKWTNVIVTVNQTTINVYIDSKLVKSFNESLATPSPTNPIKFSHFKARLADFRYYMSIINPEIPLMSRILGINTAN